MNEGYKVVTNKSWGSRIVDSIKGIVGGFLMFLGSFVLLYINEDRTDKSEVAAESIAIDAEVQNGEYNGQFVAATGKLYSDENIGDDFLKPGPYLTVSRDVEYYTWIERSESETRTKLGGGEETVTTYYCDTKEWVSDPMPSSSFTDPDCRYKFNPTKSLENKTNTVTSAKIGIYNLNTSGLQLPGSEALSLKKDQLVLRDSFHQANEKYLYKCKNSVSSPEVGDIRVSYTVVNPRDYATVMGTLNGSSISAYMGKDAKIYRAFDGNKEAAVAQLAKEHSIMTWILRIIGFMMMWGGLAALFEPLSVFLDVLPFLGSLSRTVVKIITFVVALLLSIITIIISMILHNWIAVLAVVLASIAGTIFYLKQKNQTVVKVAKAPETPKA